MDTSLEYPAAWRLAQAAPAPGSPGAGPPTSAPDAQGASASELNKQLSNPVTSLWSPAFQFNNYRLATGRRPEWRGHEPSRCRSADVPPSVAPASQ
jgi:hypothetical protein